MHVSLKELRSGDSELAGDDREDRHQAQYQR
jgi:hypothetical protein